MYKAPSRAKQPNDRRKAHSCSTGQAQFQPLRLVPQAPLPAMMMLRSSVLNRLLQSPSTPSATELAAAVSSSASMQRKLVNKMKRAALPCAVAGALLFAAACTINASEGTVAHTAARRLLNESFNNVCKPFPIYTESSTQVRNVLTVHHWLSSLLRRCLLWAMQGHGSLLRWCLWAHA
jgi:hypothetical protein